MSGVIDAPIARDLRHRQRMAVDAGGRAARTHYETEAELTDHTLLRLRLETGRTHQIRVHLSYLGYPLLGDPVYGRASGPARAGSSCTPLAWGSAIPPPANGQSIESALPHDLAGVLSAIQTTAAAMTEFVEERCLPQPAPLHAAGTTGLIQSSKPSPKERPHVPP